MNVLFTRLLARLAGTGVTVRFFHPACRALRRCQRWLDELRAAGCPEFALTPEQGRRRRLLARLPGGGRGFRMYFYKCKPAKLRQARRDADAQRL
jgi:hypothetical protein